MADLRIKFISINRQKVNRHCHVKEITCRNCAKQMLHVYGLEPVWTRMWLRSDCLNANFFWQCEQLHRKCENLLFVCATHRKVNIFGEWEVCYSPRFAHQHLQIKVVSIGSGHLLCDHFTCRVSLQYASVCGIYVMPRSWTSCHKECTQSTFSPCFWSVSSLDTFWNCAALAVNDVFCASSSSR